MKYNRHVAVVLAGLGSALSHGANADLLDDSRASLSSRTLYFENDVRALDSDQRQTATGLKFDFNSGYTDGLIGFGFDLQGVVGINLGGGIDNHSASTTNTFTPVSSDGSPVDEWSSLRGAGKVRLSKTEALVGNSLQPNLPVLVTNDGRLLPAAYSGAQITSKELDSFTFTGGRLTREIGRASSNWAGIAMGGGAHGSDAFWYGGTDWKVNKELTLQYYYANLEDYYSQHFLGLVHQFPIAEGQTFKTDLRYFNSRADGRNGSATYSFNNNGGYAKEAGEVDNNTWSAIFTYTLGGNLFLLGHQQVGDNGGMASVNNGSLRDGRGRPEGEGGSSYYLFTDSMINAFVRAGENTTFGQYAYDFAALGVPGLKASITYLHANGIKDATGNGDTYSEWERDYRIDYVIQSGVGKGIGFALRRANYRTEVPESQGGYDTDQTRFYVNYTYQFK
ncbi:outer membrane porin, OprD family [Pseudomonas sp. LB-090624]|uniref:OprD family outer membrane porin n=1 Tax=Pseudomonas sp. LB-090624 TaxID=2213079 RepID=UPI000D8D2D9F|nr:outer membrane porin, OprD family [Pseudomonas sp. LB-090624]